MIETLKTLFTSDLEKLKTEISSFKDEKNLWKTSGDVKNSAGNLSLHLCGNLQHFVGALLGNTGFIRNRDAEFSKRNIPIRELVAEIEVTMKAVEKTLKELKEEKLNEIFPSNIFGEGMKTNAFLIHLATHFNYHLGQINYLRRLIDRDF